jgi:ribonuclease T1
MKCSDSSPSGTNRSPRTLRKSWWSSALSWAICLALGLAVDPVPALDATGPGVIGEVALADLPPQARETLALIKKGGPFPYRKDGTTFQNREKRLPIRPRGYYREYTVRTPGSRDRGARRIVSGAGGNGDHATSGEYYYTADHYETFRRIRE